MTRYTGEPPTDSVDEARQKLRAYPDFETVGFGRWGCVLGAEDRLIGMCGLKYLSDLDEVDIGYRFLPAYWGNGYATEAARASIDYGFNSIGLEQIIGLVMPENTPSIRVLERIGMRCDGEFLYDGIRVIRYSISAESSRPNS